MAGHLRIDQGAETADRRASFRMWFQAKVLGSTLGQKETSSGKLPRSRRWQREKSNTACTA